MRRSLLVQTLLNMATDSGGAKLEALAVDAAGTFDAGSGKGYNPVTVPSGGINVLGEKGVVSNNSVIVTPKAQVVGGWLNDGETSGSGIEVTASELVSGTFTPAGNGTFDVSNYKYVEVSGVMQKTKIGTLTFTSSVGANSTTVNNMTVTVGEDFDALLLCGTCNTVGSWSDVQIGFASYDFNYTNVTLRFEGVSTTPFYSSCLFECITNKGNSYTFRYTDPLSAGSLQDTISTSKPIYIYSRYATTLSVNVELYGIKF